MIHVMADRIACFFVQKEIIEQDKSEIYSYGMELMISTVINGVLIVISAIVMNVFVQTIVLLIPFCLLRRLAGGYHAKTHIGCAAGFISVYWASISLIRFIPMQWGTVISAFMLIISTLIILSIGAVAHCTLQQFQEVAERRYQRNDRLLQVNNELISLSEQALVLKRLKTKRYMESALYYDQIRVINDRVKELRITKINLMETDQISARIAEFESLSAALDAGPEWMEIIDNELISEIVDKITVRSPEQISIRLVCGLELNENINKVVR